MPGFLRAACRRTRISYLHRSNGYFGRMMEIGTNTCQTVRCVVTIRPRIGIVCRTNGVSPRTRARVRDRSSNARDALAVRRLTPQRDAPRSQLLAPLPRVPVRTAVQKSRAAEPYKLSSAETMKNRTQCPRYTINNVIRTNELSIRRANQSYTASM